MRPVTQERIDIAKEYGLQNVDAAARSCRKAGLPFWAACALLEKESKGANVWGGADASPFVALAEAEVPINEDTFLVFYTLVKAGAIPTGVGPCQITYAGLSKGGVRDGGLFRIMIGRGLKPWDPEDNMFFGFETLWNSYLNNQHSWRAAGREYNGRDSYGVDLLKKCEEWRARLHSGGSINP